MNQIDIVFSFDTTGSMSGVIKSVRDNLSGTIDRLLTEVEGINIGLIAHGDYEDYFKNGQFFWSQEPTRDADVLKKFVIDAPNTNGYDQDECYEYVLHTANKIAWKSPIRLLVVIGDAEPHPKGYLLERQIQGVPCTISQEEGEDTEFRSLDLCWKEEALKLQSNGIVVFGCDCGSYVIREWRGLRKNNNHDESSRFYSEICRLTNGFHFKFSDASKQSFPHYFLAICMKAKDGAEGMDLLRQEREQLQKELEILQGNNQEEDDQEPGYVQKKERLSREIEALTPQKSEHLSISSFSSEVQASARKIREKRGYPSRLEQYQRELSEHKKVDKNIYTFVDNLERWSTQ